MIGSKVMFKYLGNIMKGEVLNMHGDEMILIKSTRGKNYVVRLSDVLSYIR